MREIQTVALTDIPHHRVHCPFCGEAVLPDAATDSEPNPCAHTLFVVDEDQARFRSGRFDECLRLEGVADAEVELPDGGWPALTLGVGLPDAVRVEVVDAPPGQISTFVGFAPVRPQSGAD
jgi:predicted nucleic acid-binding Zn ribbon protein